jgi:hypothetical protein
VFWNAGTLSEGDVLILAGVEATASGGMFFDSKEREQVIWLLKSFSQREMMSLRFYFSLVLSSFVRITPAGRFRHQCNRSIKGMSVTSAKRIDKSWFP